MIQGRRFLIIDKRMIMCAKYKTSIIATGFFAIMITMQGCHHASQTEQDTRFRITEPFLDSLLIDTVQEASARSQITLTGSIAPDEAKMVKIFPLVSGVAEDIKVQLGDVVHKGQTLAVLRSPEMAGYTKDFVSADADLRN